MRYTKLLAFAAAAGAVATPAGAQDSRASTETRIRSTAPRAYSVERSRDGEHRAALGIGTSTTGTLRDTLGLMITSITKGSPAERAGLEEGNRLSAINGVSLRANAADIEDGEMSGALTRRLQRELGKSKPGDEVELHVYRDGHSQALKVKTADSDSLFRRVEFTRTTREDMENRPALGFSLGSTGSRRDTLGVLVMSVADSTPAAKAGIEEGNRIAAIGKVDLRVPRDDAGDRWISSTKAQRLQREIAALKPGDNVTLKVYGEGKFRDITLKVARAGDLPRGRGGMMFIGDGYTGAFPAMPAWPSIPRAAPMDGYRIQLPELRETMEGVRMQLERARPQLERIGPEVRMELDRIRPQLERLREMPAIAPRVRVVNVIV
jgi:predicted metalloprotease with PDZ domain